MAGSEIIDVSGISGSALNILVIAIAILFVGGIVIGIFFLFARNKRYEEFEVVVWVKDGFGQITQKRDKGGIFVDNKTNNKRLFLQKANVGLSTEKIPFIQVRGGKKVIYVSQTGLKNFQYINIQIDDSGVALNVTEEDVNWGINSYEHSKKIFQNSLLIQLLPFLLMAFVSIIILTMFIYFFKEFKTLKEFAEIMKQALDVAVQAKAPLQVTQ